MSILEYHVSKGYYRTVRKSDYSATLPILEIIHSHTYITLIHYKSLVSSSNLNKTSLKCIRSKIHQNNTVRLNVSMSTQGTLTLAFPVDTNFFSCYVLMLAQISGEIKLCEAGECSYLRPLRTNVLKTILVQSIALFINLYL